MSIFARLLGTGSRPFPDLSEPLLYARLAHGIGKLVKARPAASSLSPSDLLTVGFESGYMKATVDILTLIREEQMRP